MHRPATHTWVAMKIIRTRSTSAGQKEQSQLSSGKEARPPGARAQATDTETLGRMLEASDEFLAGKKELTALVNELEYHLQSMSRVGQGWRQAYFGHWRDLDRELALFVRGGEQTISPAAMQRIESALATLRLLIEGKLARLDGD